MSGAQCCENPPAPSSGSGSGKVEEIGGLSSYVSGPADSNAAVILISDVFGNIPLPFFEYLIWDL